MQHNYSLQQMNASYSSQITELRSHSEALTAALSALRYTYSRVTAPLHVIEFFFNTVSCDVSIRACSVQRRGSGSEKAAPSNSSSPAVDAALAVAASTAQTLQMRSRIDEHEMAALKLRYAQALAQSERSVEFERKYNAARALEQQHKAELDGLLKIKLKYAEAQYALALYVCMSYVICYLSF
jgi:hypothetical protein